MINKFQTAKDFLKQLEDPQFTTDLLLNRIDSSIIYVINNYSENILKAKKSKNITEKDIVSSSIIIGYLLKSHLDRYELEKVLNT